MRRSEPVTLLALTLVIAGVAGIAAPARAVDPFYTGLLRDGQQAVDRKDFAAAGRALRLACFGMLEEPRALADCLVRLALAQDRAEDLDGFRDTFRRLVDVEERFGAYTQGGVAPELRAALEPRLVARLPAATLEGVAAFRGLVKKPAAPAAGGAPTAGNGGVAGAAKEARAEPKTVSPATPGPAGGQPAAAAAAPAPAPAKPAAPKPITEAERKKMDQARQLLGQPRPAKELRQAFDLAREVAEAHPDSAEAQHLAGEAAYRISRWSDAVGYFRRGGEVGEDEPERLFYFAVSLYEMGDAQGAAAALKRALPNLQRTAYVDGYVKKILGS